MANGLPGDCAHHDINRRTFLTWAVLIANAPKVAAALPPPASAAVDSALVLERMREAGATLLAMPGLAGIAAPPSAAIARMDEVLQGWLSLLDDRDHRWLASCFICGLPWDQVAARDRLGRSAEDLRRAFDAAIAALARRLSR